MEIPVDLSGFQELLASLYLRLNGYITSGFIVHAPENNLTEVDLIGVRFRHNAEPERDVDPSEWLQIPDSSIDIVLGEVKGRNAQLQFNAAFRENRQSVSSILRWIGVINKEQIIEKVDGLILALSPPEIQTNEGFNGITLNSDVSGSISIRGILFAPDRLNPRQNQPRFIYGQEMLDFIWKCFCPETPRPCCATQYDFNLWGIYQPIVRYFKNRKQANQSQGNMQDMYQHFGF